MSLINDALKRASQSDKDQPREASTRSPMQAVEEAPGRSKLPILLWIVLALLLTATAIFIWRGASNPPVTLASSKPTEANKTVAPAPATPVEATPAPKVVPVQSPATPPPAPAAPVAIQQPLPTPTNSPVPPVIPFPDLRVKAIIYRPQDPLAIINGKTVGIGNKVEGARVIKIQRQNVVLEFNGQVRDVPMD